MKVVPYTPEADRYVAIADENHKYVCILPIEETRLAHAIARKFKRWKSKPYGWFDWLGEKNIWKRA